MAEIMGQSDPKTNSMKYKKLSESGQQATEVTEEKK